MSAKISIGFGTHPGWLPMDKALEFFLGCADALQEMGLFHFKSLANAVEVLRIYPNAGIMTEHQVVIEAVVAWASRKEVESVVIRSDMFDLRLTVKTEVEVLVRKLAKKIQSALQEESTDLSVRLGEPTRQ